MYTTTNKVPAGTSSYDHDGEDGDHSVIRKIVEEHGLAKGHHAHAHGDGTHTVVSHHEDGHAHISHNHPSYSHAHEHIGIAHGVA